ncbi:dihydrofolate reductase family protein [Knoellia sp. S7-12]|uniref:RibD family protein n=1 Tax=Knoellia sp. S7-12 TaxID=3126698 RepID=UPI0033672958
MTDLPYTVLSCAMSLDGYLDDASGKRLVLSNAADLDRVDEVRAGSDAILVGAGTVRADNPRLLVRAAHRRERRVAEGQGPSPRKVTVTRHTLLDPSAAFFTTGECDKYVYCASATAAVARERLGEVATVVDAGVEPSMRAVSEDLAARGVHRLLVEGGQNVHTQFLRANLADELHVVVAPFFVGDSRAHRVVADGPLPWSRTHRADLVDVQRIEDVVLMRYALSERCGVQAFEGELRPYEAMEVAR